MQEESNTNDKEYLARQVERLVDGELDDNERRELLLQLEQQPSEWRRVALALLEDRCLGESLRDWDGNNDLPTAVADRPVANVARKSRERRTPAATLINIAAVAASLLIAFTLGTAYGPSGDDPSQSNRPGSASLAQGGPSSAPPSGDQATEVPDRSDDGLVQLAADDPSDDRSNDAWLLDPRSELSERLLRLIEQSGHRVRRQQEWWPVDMADGERGLMPVERVEVELIDYEIQ